MAITFVTPRESRLLHAIERATRSPIEWLAVPGHEQLAEHRIQAFKRQMKDVLEGDEELAFFRQLIRDFAAENGCSTEDAAAALAFQLQRKRPLQPPPDKIVPQRPPRPQRERAVRPGGQERGRDGGARRPRAVESDLESFRIDVGREHGVNPSHIVGAIANEIGLDSGRIGRIQLYDTHSTVDLPRGMPNHVLKHLQQVRIFQRPLAIQRVADHSTPGSAGSRSFEDRTPVHPPDRSDKKRDGSRPVKNRARPAGPSVLVAPSTSAPETDGSSLPAKRLVKKKRPADDKPKRFDKGKKLGAKSKGPKKNRKDRNKGKPKRKEP
jgi:ATP-dependent RNA helicase DeaD